MSTFDLESLLREIAPESPSGENLEYDALFLEMERAAQGKPEQQMGDQTIAAEDPNWEEVKKKALDLAARTHDLRVGVYLAQALLRTDGLPGFRDALALLRGYVGRWDTVHPQLDPEEDNDPTMRVNALVTLGDTRAVLDAVRRAPLVRSRLAGPFTYRDLLVAQGVAPPSQDSEPPTEALIDGAFSDCDLADLQALTGTCREARETAIALDAELTERAGPAHAADLAAIPDLLGEIHDLLAERLARRGIDTSPVRGPSSEATAGSGSDAPASGEIRSRDDVVRLLERIARYYETHEPSSPIPLLLERAKRLVYSSFLELMTDLAPDALPQIENLRGRTRRDESGGGAAE